MIKILDSKSNNFQSKLNTMLSKRQSGVKKNISFDKVPDVTKPITLDDLTNPDKNEQK